jgi:NAD(P)-dependent dehydrogenase (short-subunit alcohol dehydrogenase family)
MTEATRANPDRLERLMGRIPAGRLGQPDEIAGPVVFLASPLASYVNGTMLSADGGYSAV